MATKSKEKMKAKETVRQYYKRIGSQEKAAQNIGVSFSTLSGWLRGKTEPDELSRIKLDRLGIGEVG